MLQQKPVGRSRFSTPLCSHRVALLSCESVSGALSSLTILQEESGTIPWLSLWVEWTLTFILPLVEIAPIQPKSTGRPLSPPLTCSNEAAETMIRTLSLVPTPQSHAAQYSSPTRHGGKPRLHLCPAVMSRTSSLPRMWGYSLAIWITYKFGGQNSIAKALQRLCKLGWHLKHSLYSVPGYAF